ncbi:MAG TPA: Hsp70 family protein [Microlunatus sp.]|nr:Hsp70 family protein [Microlunatus sp.]
MGYRLGIDLGTTYTAAAYVDNDAPRMLELGNRNVSVPSVLLAAEDGRLIVGEAAERRAAAEPERVLREFKRRFGDAVPMVAAGRSFDPAELQTELLRWVLHTATERLGSAPEHVVVTHPANWGPYKMQLMRTLVASAGIPDAGLCPEPVAAAIEYAAKRQVPVGAKITVYDLGGGTFDVAVLEKTRDDFTILGTPLGIEHLGGTDFDEAVFAAVLSRLGVDGGLDIDDPAVARGLTALRRECVEAKEALSGDDTTEIASLLPGAVSSLQFTRSEFEALIRPALQESISATHRALRLASVQASEIHAIVLVGGSSRIPLVTELLNRELGAPVALDTYPKNDIALGAARHALRLTAPQAPSFAPFPVTPGPTAGPTPIPPPRSAPAAPPGFPDSRAVAGDTARLPPLPPYPMAQQPHPRQPISGQAVPRQPDPRQPDPQRPMPAPPDPQQVVPPGPRPAWMTGPGGPPGGPGGPGGAGGPGGPVDGTQGDNGSRNSRRILVAALIGVAVIVLGVGTGVAVHFLRAPTQSGSGPAVFTPTAAPASHSLTPSATPSLPDPVEFGLPVGDPISTRQFIAPITAKAGQNGHLKLINADDPSRARDLRAQGEGSVFGVGLSLNRRTITYIDSGANAIRSMPANGGKGQLLFTAPGSCGNIRHASWSPTDLAIMVLECQVGDTGPKRLMVVRIDGTVEHELNTGQKNAADPTISPDGTEVAFWGSSTLANGDGGSIFVMPVDGSSAPRRVTDGKPGVDGDPAWSPDGRSLAIRRLSSDPPRTYDVVVIPASGGPARTILDGPANDEKPSWSPDGATILAVSNRDDNGKPTSSRELWRIPAGGGDPVALDLRSHRISTSTWFRR